MIKHIPVLLKESIDALDINSSGVYIDCNFGQGGHTSKILELGGKVIAFDVDQFAIDRGTESFSAYIKRGDLMLIRENFANIHEAISELGYKDGSIDGILYDLGLSTLQLKTSGKGFSFTDETSLDMRMDDRLTIKGQDLVWGLSERELTDLIKRYGEDPQAKTFAHAIKVYVSRLYSPDDIQPSVLANVIQKASKYSDSRIHPATRVFQAIRIAVNSELENLELSLQEAIPLLKKGGLLAVITFHSLEDKIVKNLSSDSKTNNFNKNPNPTKDSFISNKTKAESSNYLATVNDKPITPSEEEVFNNPAARSAKLRVFKKL